MKILQPTNSDSNKLASIRREHFQNLDSNMSPSEIGDFMSKMLIEQIKKDFDHVLNSKDESESLQISK